MRWLAFLPLSVAIACSTATGTDETEDARTEESMLTTSEKEAVCNAIPRARSWTPAESKVLLDAFVASVVKRKVENDALIASRGVGGYAGAGTEVWKAIERGDKAAAAALLRPKLKPGNDPLRVAGEIKGTSCIGYLYTVFKEVYATLGRESEWAAIEKCGRAWDSDGLHVQQALIRNGWVSPTLGFISDETKIPGGANEVAMHREFLRSQRAGSYFGTPVSKTKLLKNFLPTPGSSTPDDDAHFLRIGRGTSLVFGTFRGAFHTPAVVPAASIPVSVAPTDGTRAAWLAARERGEPFVLESHRLRQAWDPTNFEIRPLTFVMEETFDDSVTYATGTLLFAPGGEGLLQ